MYSGRTRFRARKERLISGYIISHLLSSKVWLLKVVTQSLLRGLSLKFSRIDLTLGLEVINTFLGGCRGKAIDKGDLHKSQVLLYSYLSM